MRAILMASAAIFVVSTATPGVAADLALVRGQRAHTQYAGFVCPPVPGGVLYGRIDRYRQKVRECHFDDWQDRPGIDVVWNNWNLW